MRKPSKKDWQLFGFIAAIELLCGYFYSGSLGLLVVFVSIICATGNLVGLGAFCRIAGNLQEDVRLPFNEFFLLLLLVTQKFPIIIGGWFWAQSLKEPYPTCFLWGAGVVYFVLICWVARPE